MAVVRPFVLGAGLLLEALSFVLVGPGAACAQQPPPTAQTVTVEQLAGNYQLPDGRVVGINPFSGDGGPPSPLFTDYTTGAIRTLVPQQDERFGMGPSFGVRLRSNARCALYGARPGPLLVSRFNDQARMKSSRSDFQRMPERSSSRAKTPRWQAYF